MHMRPPIHDKTMRASASESFNCQPLQMHPLRTIGMHTAMPVRKHANANLSHATLLCSSFLYRHKEASEFRVIS